MRLHVIADSGDGGVLEIAQRTPVSRYTVQVDVVEKFVILDERSSAMDTRRRRCVASVIARKSVLLEGVVIVDGDRAT